MGIMIVVEGVGGMGKSTQKERLVENLKELYGDRVHSFDFPRYGIKPYGPLIRAYLDGAFGNPNDVSPYMAGMLYAQDRAGLTSVLRNLIIRDSIIVTGRYTGSNLAYQGVKCASDIELAAYVNWQNELEYVHFQAVKETMTIVLHAPAAVSQSLIDQRHISLGTDVSARDGHEQDTGYVQRITDLYLRLAGWHPHWRTLDCADLDSGGLRDEEDISEDIWKIVHSILPL